MSAKVTWAILFTGPGADTDEPLYVCRTDELTGGAADSYAYCCPCKETIQFDTEAIAAKFMERQKINREQHKAIDSVTAGAQRATRKPKAKTKLKIGAAPMQRPKSALTGVILKA